MKKCRKCGNVFGDDHGTFCPLCGIALVNLQAAAPTTQGPMQGQTAARSVYVIKPPQKHPVQTVCFNLFYSFMMFFMLFPMIFSPKVFTGIGEYGYGIRQQIGAFDALADGKTNKALLLLIQSGVILLIVAAVLAVSFSLLSIIMVSREPVKEKGINYRLLKIFNLFIFGSLTLILIFTFKYLTFTFMFAYMLSLLALIMNFRPSFAEDILCRKQNENRNSAALSLLMLSVILAFCFSHIYTVNIFDNLGWQTIPQGLSFYSLATTFSSTVDGFLLAVSLSLMALIFLLFIYVLIAYLANKKVMFIIINIGLAITLMLSVLIGAYIRMENMDNGSGVQLKLSYYIMIVFTVLTLVMYLIQKTLDYTKKDGKKQDEIPAPTDNNN